MPVQRNIGVQTVGTVAWDGTNANHGDIRKWTHFAWSFEVLTDLAADAVFNIQSAPPSDADICAPGSWSAVPEVATCEGAEAGEQATVTIPAGTVAGTVCSGTIPCRPNAFVRLNHVSGGTNVRAVMLRQGPKMG